MNKQTLISQFARYRVLVVGDFMLDVYHKGISSRIAPEAPVPVVEIQNKQYCLGGAANVVFNLKALGAQPYFCTVIGADQEGGKGRQLLKANNISTSFIIHNANRRTLIKQRVVSGEQTLVRFDRGTVAALDTAAEDQLMQMIKSAYNHCDAVILSDYNKGIFTDRIIHFLSQLRRQRPLFMAVDSGRLQRFCSLQPDAVKPNYPEALKLLQKKSGFQKDRISDLILHGKPLGQGTGAAIVALTIDTEGVLLFQNKEFVGHIPALKVPHPHVAGAGDTFISAFSLMQLSGAAVYESAEVAIAAAGLSIQKPDTACCSNNELYCYYVRLTKQITTVKELDTLCNVYHMEGKSIVFTNGCFDILHSGHVNYLNRAARLGDIMIVGLNTDESIHRLKGVNRPINPLSDRIEVLSALHAVTHLITFGTPENDTPSELIKAICPEVYVKGGDYSKKDLPEAELVESHGGVVRILSHIPDHSTTRVIRQIQQLNGVEQ